jgi:hypothetical protein
MMGISDCYMRLRRLLQGQRLLLHKHHPLVLIAMAAQLLQLAEAAATTGFTGCYMDQRLLRQAAATCYKRRWSLLQVAAVVATDGAPPIYN